MITFITGLFIGGCLGSIFILLLASKIWDEAEYLGPRKISVILMPRLHLRRRSRTKPTRNLESDLESN